MSSFTTSINLPQGSSFSPPAWQPHLQRLCSLLVAFVHINLISSPRPLTPSVPAIPLISNLRVISSAFSSLWQSLSWRLNPDWTVHNSYERHLFFLLFYCQLAFLHFSPSVFCALARNFDTTLFCTVHRNGPSLRNVIFPLAHLSHLLTHSVTS